MRRAPNGALRPLDNVPLAVHERLVIKHRAPNGALRPGEEPIEIVPEVRVIKHRAPNGALRLIGTAHLVPSDKS